MQLLITIYCLTSFSLLFSYDYLPNRFRDYYFVLYTLIEYLFFAFMISSGIINKKLKFLTYFLSVGFLLFHLVFGLSHSRLDSFSIAIETILLFIFIILFFYDHSINNKQGYIYNHPVFWLSVGILFYLGGSFFFNILINYMTSDEVSNFWHYTYFAEILKNVLFVIAIFKTSHQTKINSLNRSQIPFLDIDIDMN